VSAKDPVSVPKLLLQWVFCVAHRSQSVKKVPDLFSQRDGVDIFGSRKSESGAFF
jgi:hypothetical protein